MEVQIIDMPDDPHVHSVCANRCVAQWQRDFPLDTAQWYLDLYAEAAQVSTLPLVLVAVDGDEFVGTAALIIDDELPDAREPGPWLAAVLVNEQWRRRGVGASLVREIIRRARALDIHEVFLYTEKSSDMVRVSGVDCTACGATGRSRRDGDVTSLRRAHLTPAESTCCHHRSQHSPHTQHHCWHEQCASAVERGSEAICQCG